MYFDIFDLCDLTGGKSPSATPTHGSRGVLKSLEMSKI